MVDQNFLVINSNQEIQLVATGGGTLTFTSDDLPEGVILSSDGILTNFTADGIYTFTVKCSSSYGVEDSAEITVKVDFSLIKTQNNLTSDQSNQNFYVSQRTTSGSYNAWKAMDGNKSTYSMTKYASGQTDWWQIEFVSPVILSQIYLNMNNQSSTQSYLQASNDGSNWVNLMTSTIADPFDSIIQLNLETPYKYYRFLADRTNYYIQIYEVVFYYKYAENYLSAKNQTITAKLDEQFTYQIEYLNYSETPVQFYLDSELPEGIYFDETTGTFSGSSSVQITEYLSVRLTNTYKTIFITITLEISMTSITPHNLTSNTSDPRYILSMSDNLESAKRHAWNAMDGSLDQQYGCAHTGRGTNKWWKIQFTEYPVYIEQFILTNRTSGGAGGTSLILQGSTDNNTWVDVYPFNIDTTNGKIFEFVVNSQQAYKYWRIFQTTSNYLIIGQIEFHYRYSLQ